jgi:hypothetical protein
MWPEPEQLKNQTQPKNWNLDSVTEYMFSRRDRGTSYQCNNNVTFHDEMGSTTPPDTSHSARRAWVSHLASMEHGPPRAPETSRTVTWQQHQHEIRLSIAIQNGTAAPKHKSS